MSERFTSSRPFVLVQNERSGNSSEMQEFAIIHRRSSVSKDEDTCFSASSSGYILAQSRRLAFRALMQIADHIDTLLACSWPGGVETQSPKVFMSKKGFAVFSSVLMCWASWPRSSDKDNPR
jgi:hypothetical protein